MYNLIWGCLYCGDKNKVSMYYRSLAGKYWHTIRKCAEKEVPEGTTAEYIKQTEKPILNGEIYLCPECGYIEI
jgi:hypothetical protein